jgi:hypothetical protein
MIPADFENCFALRLLATKTCYCEANLWAFADKHAKIWLMTNIAAKAILSVDRAADINEPFSVSACDHAAKYGARGVLQSFSDTGLDRNLLRLGKLIVACAQ